MLTNNIIHDLSIFRNIQTYLRIKKSKGPILRYLQFNIYILIYITNDLLITNTKI